mmetsp:Transcript_44366/g.80393  ORF Transcript_44366/g.80393 Transcript_44366/m.80393 type:complete len:314 (-) Transcript_44366:604-1545(-)
MLECNFASHRSVGDGRDARQRHGHLRLWVRVVHQGPRVPGRPRGHVEVAVAAEVEEDHLALLRLLRLPDGPRDRVVRLRGRQDAFGLGKEGARLEALLLRNGLRLKLPDLLEVRDERRHAVVSQAARVRRWGHEGVPQGVGLYEGRHLGGVPEVVGVLALREGGAAGRLHGQAAELLLGLSPELLPDEGEAEPSEVGAAPCAADDDVGIVAGHLHLVDGLQSCDCLVHQDVVQHAAQRVLVLGHGRGSLDRLGDGNAQGAGAAGILRKNLPAVLRAVGGRREALGAPSLHQRAAVGLLVVGNPDLVDLDLNAE